jgi:N-methylhydantoinase B/oxoprolinase/acetone carboxylase alpha subunit
MLLVVGCRERNRFHAHQSRMRRKSLTFDLHTQVASLREENARLRKLIGEDKAMAALEKIRSDSHSRFVQALQKPQNRRLRKRAVNFLKKLQKDIPENTAC